MNSFQEDKYYVMSSPGEKWSDFDGPFNSQDEAVDHLKLLVNEQRTFSPEMLMTTLVVRFKNNQLDIVRVDGHPLNGAFILESL